MEHWLEWLYDVRHMAKDNLDNERGNQLPLLLAIHFKVFFYIHQPTDRILHTMTFDTPDAIPVPTSECYKGIY